MSGAEIVQILTALFSLIGVIFTTYITLLVARLKAQHEIARVEIQDVKTTLTTITDDQNLKIDVMAANVEQVHLATNSLTERLVEETRVGAHAAGIKEEKERTRK